MLDLLKFKLMAALMILLVATGCSKHPDTVVIGTNAVPEGVEVSSTAYLFNSDLLTVAEKMQEINKYYSHNSEVINGEIEPSFAMSNDTTNEYMTALNEVKAIYSSIPSKVKKAQAEKVSIEEGNISEIQNKIDKQNALQATLDNFTKAERGALAEINQEIEAKQQSLKQQQTTIIHAMNDYIISKKLPIKKLDENESKPFSWDTRRAYKGKCSERKGQYYTEGTSHLSQCLYFKLGYKLAREKNAADLAQVVKANINPYIEADWALKMSVGDKHGLYRKKNDAEKSLKQAIIIAENQTDINARTIKRTLITLNRKLDRANESLVQVKKYPVTADDLLRENEAYAIGLKQVNTALSKIKKEMLKSAIDDGIIVAKGQISGTEGQLPSSNGDYLMMHIVFSSGYRKESGFGFTNLNQEWQDKVYLDKDNAIFDSASSIDSDLDALDIAVVAMNKYERKYGASDKG